MDSKEYWLKREQAHAQELRKVVSGKTDEIMKEYRKALNDIEADINRNFLRYAKEGNMTMAEAMKLADKMDVERFAKKAKEYVDNMDNSPKANADLKLYNLKMRVSRLQLLKMEINLEIDRLAGKLNDEAYKHLRKVALDEYRRQAGILGQALKFDDKKVKHLVNASYKLGNGFVTFSDNIWHNTEALKVKLGSVLNSVILQGKNPNQYISEFKKIFDAQPYQVGRLLITETARVQGDVQLDSYKQGGIEWYDISFESGACRICRRAASGGPYRHDRAVVGYNMYPFHPNCLCSIMPAEEPNSNAKTDNLLKKLLFGSGDKDDSGSDKLMLSKQYIDDLMKDINLKTATPDDIIKLGKAFNYRYDVAGNIGNKEKLKEMFANHREMGGVVPNNRWAKGSNKAIREQLEEAFSYYPKEWSDMLIGSGRQMLARKHPDRGFFSKGAAKANGRAYDTKYDNYLDGYLTITAEGERKTTPYHEIGHMVEFFNKDLVRIEKEWVDQRTKGEKPTRLLDIFPKIKYDPSEVVKKDDFVDPYIGKYYDNAAEVFTMGIQGIFETSELYVNKWDKENNKYLKKSIVDDPEYLNLIIGLILKG
ncbi:minor capsid protein [Ligilactobacillus murinus]|uniref:minor capsid protein n=1 Tax=Ligilactobacillus murinus TaxID=1622 RepID=UPI002DD67D50|nr:minor capsid protein [Ligilactobacillus murinus]WRY37090.1 minor capsid protein [Ligilactobacillus murinus]